MADCSFIRGGASRLFSGLLLRRLALIALALNVSACSWLFGNDGYFHDRADDYRKATVEPPLKIPDGLQDSSIDDSFAIPPVSDEEILTGAFTVPRPEPLSEDVERDAVRINSLGEQQWILVDGSPGQVWPRLRGFLALNNLPVARADAASGMFETTWMQPKGETALKERYRLRVDQGVQRGTSEVYVLQVDQRAGEQWSEKSTNNAREEGMVQALAQYLADSQNAASVSMLAQQTISTTGKVTIKQSPNEEPRIELDLPFSRAWASLGRALKKVGFEIDDLNRSGRVYYVRETLPVDSNVEEEEESSGFFSNLFGGDNPDDDKSGIAYYVNVHIVDTNEVTITIERQSGEPMEDGEALRLLKAIKRYLS